MAILAFMCSFLAVALFFKMGEIRGLSCINEKLSLKLHTAEARLGQYDHLIAKLKSFDWFEFNSGGGIIAHEKNEPQSDFAVYGTGFVVPSEVYGTFEIEC